MQFFGFFWASPRKPVLNAFLGGRDIWTSRASIRLTGMISVTARLPSSFSITSLLCSGRWHRCPFLAHLLFSSRLIAHFPSAFNHLIPSQACTSHWLCLGKHNNNDNNNLWKGISAVISLCSYPFSLLEKWPLWEKDVFLCLFKNLFYPISRHLLYYQSILLNLIIFNAVKLSRNSGLN